MGQAKPKLSPTELYEKRGGRGGGRNSKEMRQRQLGAKL